MVLQRSATGDCWDAAGPFGPVGTLARCGLVSAVGIPGMLLIAVGCLVVALALFGRIKRADDASDWSLLFAGTVALVPVAVGLVLGGEPAASDGAGLWGSFVAHYLRKGLAVRDALRDDPLVSFTLAPHAPYTVADATLRRIATYAEELDLPVHIHAHETAGEVADGLREHGLRPLARLQRLGLVTERLIAVHAVHLEDAEIALLAERGASVAHCPSSNLKLASGFAPVARLLAAGVNVAIGTDGAASNDRLDVMEDMRLAALLAKGVSQDATALPAWRALEGATLSGARALGLEARIGSLEPGKEADLAAFDLGALELQPCFDPLAQLVYAAGRDAVTDVWVRGTPVVRKRQAVKGASAPPLDAIRAMMAAWQNRIRQSLESPAHG